MFIGGIILTYSYFPLLVTWTPRSTAPLWLLYGVVKKNLSETVVFS